MRAMHIILHTLLFGSLVFSPPAEYPDLALECSAIENAKAMPVEMPRATAFLRSGDGGQWLEDRFDVLDLWRAESIRARWQDEEGNILSICRIRRKIPGDAGGETRTRVDYAARYSAATLGERELDALDEAVYLLSPVCVTLREAPRRSQRQNLSALWRYETTNENAFVFAFRPRAETRADADWYMVALISDDPEAEEKIDQWLDDVEWLRSARSGAPGMADGASARTGSRRVAKEAEREVRLLADDYRKNVVNYNDWHFTSVSNLVIVDNMAEADSRPFIAALTNGLPRLQAAYREMLPSPLAIDTHIAAVRIFRSRSEYLAYVGGEMKWSAALWSPQRRELVLFKVHAVTSEVRNEIIQVANIFRGSVIDVSRETLTLSIIGDEKKIDGVRDILEGFGIIELARTGMIALERGKYTINDESKVKGEFNYGKNVL